MKRNPNNKIDKKEIKRFLLTNGTGPMQDVVDRITTYYNNRIFPVFIIGESGSGKEYVAKTLLSNGKNFQNSKFVAINCAAFTEGDLLRSELFGHVKGAFTGAADNRDGILRKVAKDNTYSGVFLDEIDKSSLNFQYKLLRYLRTGEIQPVGSDNIDNIEIVPIVLAASTSIESLFKNYCKKLNEIKESDPLYSIINDSPSFEGCFEFEVTDKLSVSETSETDSIKDSGLSKDFFNRVRNFMIIMPPLRERVADLGIILKYIIKRSSEELRIEIKYIDGNTLDFIFADPIPDNFGELEGLLKTGIIHSVNGVITRYCIGHFYNIVSANANIAARYPYKYLGGEYYYAYLRKEETSDLSPDAKEYPRYCFKIDNLERIIENMIFLNGIDFQCPPTIFKINKDFDFEKVNKYFELMSKYKQKTKTYKELGFKSIEPFNNWLKKMHLDGWQR